MTGNLFSQPGGETMYDDVESVAVRAWEDGAESPVTVEEWTAKPLRSFVRTGHVIDRVCEYDLEEYLDEWGDVAGHLERRAADPDVIAAFDAALDLLFRDVTWRWADELVGHWTVSWSENDDDAGAPDFKIDEES
jgi:hypothetical protein